MIDTHAHLDLCDDPDGAVERARQAGVTRILTVGTGPASWPAALELAARHDGVGAILGVHPHEAASGLDGLADAVEGGRVAAVGETGLDFYRDRAPRDAQRAAFAGQLELAKESGKAVVIHSRAAEEELGRLLEAYAGTVVLHCFSSPRLLPQALERGYFVSFAGNVTYPNATDLRLAATQVPADRILAETDSPYLAPQARRGRPNEPAYVVHTLAALARARGEDPGELERRIDENASRAFSLG
ncbi:MAG: TatD family hydrolase [Thermoleophilia bacterium]|nr:TatD family hydrolase [Thermoleophilia bacterium]